MAQIVKLYATAGKLDRLETELGEFELGARRLRGLRSAMLDEYERTGKFAEALSIPRNHPEMISSEPSFAARLRTLAGSSGDYADVALLFEKAIGQSEDRSASWLEDAALFYKDWADRELAVFHTDAAIDHLKRAREIKPGRFDIAQQLCNLYLETRQPERAQQVLDDFLDVSQNEAERDKAREMLSRLSKERG